jgi:hypothetical protein
MGSRDALNVSSSVPPSGLRVGAIGFPVRTVIVAASGIFELIPFRLNAMTIWFKVKFPDGIKNSAMLSLLLMAHPR